MIKRFRKLFPRGYAKIAIFAVLFLTVAAALLFITGQIAIGATPNLWTITYIGPQTLITGQPARLSYFIKQYSGGDPNIIVPVTTLGGVTVYNSAHNLSCETGGRIEAGGIVTCMFVINVPASLSGIQTLSTRFDMYRVSNKETPELPVPPLWNTGGAYGGTVDTVISIVSGAGPTPICNDKSGSIQALCERTDIPVETPNSGCQITSYENFIPAILTDGSAITHIVDVPGSPGYITRTGGTLCSPPPSPSFINPTNLLFKVVEGSLTGPLLGGARLYKDGILAQPSNNFVTSASDLGGGFNLKFTDISPESLGGLPEVTISGITFGKDGYNSSNPSQIVKIVKEQTKSYTFVLTRLPPDYTISATNVSVIKGQQNFSTIVLNPVPGGPVVPVTLNYSGILAPATANFSSGGPAYSCTPTCATTLSIQTYNGNTSGSYTINVNGTATDPVSGQAVNRTTSFTLTINPTPLPANFVLTVTKSGAGFGSISSDPAGISNCIDVCTANYSSGQLVTLTATASAGSSFAGWGLNNCDSLGGANGEKCIVTMTSARSVTATFNNTPQPPLYLLSVFKEGFGIGIVSGPSGINCGTSCGASFPSGTPVVLIANANAGSSFASWGSVDCDSMSGLNNNECHVTMTSASRSVTARFNNVPPPLSGFYRLTVSVIGSGIVGGPLNINCSASGINCSADFSSGSPVTLTASPNAGSSFAGWGSGNCDSVSGLDNIECRITMTSARNVTATFNNTPPPLSGSYNLTVNKLGTG